ncbi:MAG: hypothetical protein Q9162_004642 [Coniocarpon cinnabarinum]
MSTLTMKQLVLFGLASSCLAAPARNGPARSNSGKEHRNNIKARQDAPAVNPANNVWPGRTQGAIVLDMPTGVAASGPPDARGQAYPTSSLFGPNGLPVSGDAAVPSPTLIPEQHADSKDGLILDLQNVENPQAIRGSSGGTHDEAVDTSRYDRDYTDIFAAPGTDSGSVDQAQWPLGLSHNRLAHGGAGWARQQNVDVLPAALEMAGVDMRLSPNAYRLHWHQASEWSYMLNGSARVTAVNENGESFVDDISQGDLWFFPSGVPHSIQAFEDGCEFLLVFDDGYFSEDGTSLVTEMMLRNPLEVIAKDLQTDISSFDDIPSDQLYIFEGTPAPTNINEQKVTGPNGAPSIPATQYSYHFSQQEPMVIPGAGSLKIADPTVFPAAADMSCALVTIEPGAMRELHWHLQSDEWNFFISGTARITVYSPPSSSRTFDYGPGDVGYIPQTLSHYIENTGDEPVVLLEMLKQPKFTVVKDTLSLPDTVLDNLPKYKPYSEFASNTRVFMQDKRLTKFPSR